MHKIPFRKLISKLFEKQNIKLWVAVAFFQKLKPQNVHNMVRSQVDDAYFPVLCLKCKYQLSERNPKIKTKVSFHCSLKTLPLLLSLLTTPVNTRINCWLFLSLKPYVQCCTSITIRHSQRVRVFARSLSNASPFQFKVSFLFIYFFAPLENFSESKLADLEGLLMRFMI